MSDWKKKLADSGVDADSVRNELAQFKVETPSWGYANTGTRFGKFLQAGAALTLEHKVQDAAEVHRLTGIAPTMAVHVLWDFPEGFDPAVVKLAAEGGLKIGAINPNVFQDQHYKSGSFASPDPAAREAAVKHCLDSVKIGEQAGSGLLSMWFADGTNYPGQDDIVSRKRRMTECLKKVYAAMPESMTMLVEYKPFEPAFYQTDIPDWGTAALLARACGDRAKVLVDTGHHLLGTNVEQIVAILLDEGLLGGFHFNDRKYADDDLTAGSISPYQMFLIFDQIVAARARGGTDEIAYMIDQSHNLKPKVEAMVQTVVSLQELYAKALLVDRARLTAAREAGDIVASEECLKRAFFTDVSGLLAEVRESMGAPADPLAALRKSGYEARRAAEREADGAAGSSYA
ncbi:MAG: L-rhamnose isomerase [Planctomycetota bacterium]